MSPRGDGDGAGGSLPRPGHGVPYLARRGWRVTSSAPPHCWWPHTRICPGPSPRCSRSAEPLWGEGRRLGQSGEARGRPRGGPGGLFQSPVRPVSRSGWAGEADKRAELAHKLQLGQGLPGPPGLAPNRPEHTTLPRDPPLSLWKQLVTGPGLQKQLLSRLPRRCACQAPGGAL